MQSWKVCLGYCMRRMHNCFVKWLISNTVFTSYYLRKKFYPWNSALLIVFLPCHGVILTYTSVRLYCKAYLRMPTRIECKSTVLLKFCYVIFSMAFDRCSLNDYLLTYLLKKLACMWPKLRGLIGPLCLLWQFLVQELASKFDIRNLHIFLVQVSWPCVVYITQVEFLTTFYTTAAL